MFLSDIVTADGRKLENYVFDPGGGKFISKYQFPKENPTKRDWEYWTNFWSDYTDDCGVIPSPLEQWQHPSHRIWEWFYDEDRNTLYQTREGRTKFFIPSHRGRATRSQHRFRLAWTETQTITKLKGKPTSVIPVGNDEYLLLRTGPDLITKGPSMPDNFWEFLS